MKKHHRIDNVAFVRDKMVLVVDTKKYTFALADVSKRLAGASRAERETYEVSPSGYGIHWPLIDEDLSIDGLIGLKHERVQTRKSASA
ncbi:MAG: DUF2442 domain-containing protein [Phycisphaerales bacterium]|nr:MAG: DUF2442 domain-containing protein [Phycisphaerales bacterium]